MQIFYVLSKRIQSTYYEKITSKDHNKLFIWGDGSISLIIKKDISIIYIYIFKDKN
ncbi:hypothetical protein Hanom_Chr14g01325031 [Helianthus anomalus]